MTKNLKWLCRIWKGWAKKLDNTKKIATRESYGKTLLELGREHEDIMVLDADLAASTKTSVFRKEFPDRHINCGIAESNMMGVAAGLATCGFVPFVSSFAMFATARPYEQIRNSIAYPHLNVKICASHAGLSVGEDGATHQCIEDIALMNFMPGMIVISPSDDIEACAAVRAAYAIKGPVYMRLGRLAVPVINTDPSYKFELGKGVKLRDGSDVTLIATGLEVAYAVEAAEMLKAAGISASVINIHTIKPIDRDIIISEAAKTSKIVTIEEHSTMGGLGSSVADVLCEEGTGARLLKIGVDNCFGESGPALELLHKFGLDAEGITASVRKWLGK